MCGIFGQFTLHPDLEVFNTSAKIMLQSKIRGLHSFGASIPMDKETTKTIKSFELEELICQLRGQRPSSFIFHNRYSTSGDYKDHNNNQPVVSGQQSLVFNGVISMATKEENEKRYGVKLETENDGEILLKQHDKSTFLKELKGSFAGLWIEGGKIFFYRNDRRPAWYASVENGVLVASTADIFKRAGARFCTLMPPNEIINLEQFYVSIAGVPELSF